MPPHGGPLLGRRLLIRGVPYRLEEDIGYGLHSSVYGARDLSTGQLVAIKVIEFGRLGGGRVGTESRRQSFWKELGLLLDLQPLNPYVIRLLNWDYRDTQGIIVMERGDTFRDTLIQSHLSETLLPPDLVKRFWSQMVEAIFYLHRVGLVHGDVKPENFIQVGRDGTALRLIDMGISFRLPPFITSQLKTAAGTPDYVAPELINSRFNFGSKSKFGYKTDIWALGVILFEMAFGYRPLQSLGDNENKISFLGKMKRDLNIPPHPDPMLRDALKKCLRANPRRRPTAEQLLNHPYLR